MYTNRPRFGNKNRETENINRPKTSKGPSKQILITIAVCFSVILGSVAYKVALSQKTEAIQDSIVAMQGNSTTTGDLIANALQEAQLNALTGENATSANPFDVQSGDTLSDRISKKVFTGYLVAQQSDGVTDESASGVADSVISQINENDLPQPQFLNSQVKVFKPNSKDQIKQYGNSLAKIILATYQTVANNKAKYNSDALALAKLYKNLGNSIMGQSAPIDMVSNHAGLANSYVLTGQGLEMLAAQDTDPVKALLGLKTIKDVDQSQMQVLINISAYFKKNDIIFTSTDSGSFWNQYANIIIDENASNQANSSSGN